MRIFYHKNLLLFRHKIKYFLLVVRKKKTIFGLCFQMNVMWLMNKPMKYKKGPLWIVLAQDINWHISIGNLNLKLKISFMPLALNIQMRHQRSVRCMIFLKINGQKFVIWSSHDITIPSQFLTADICML